MAIEGSNFELGVISDPRAIRQFLSELEVVPAALKRISQAINSVDLGDGRKFAGDGRQLAEAFINAARSELSGGSFQRAFREAMSGVDLRIPAEAQAHLRSDLERINSEIRRLLPQQVQIGIRANTSGQAFRDVLQAQAPQAFAQQQQQVSTQSFAALREEARQLRQSARQAELGTTRERSGGASANELLKAADLVDRTSERYQAAALRLSEATDKGARTLERVATREEIRAASEQRFPGGPDAREGALARATEAQRDRRAARQLNAEQLGIPQLTPGESSPLPSASFRRLLDVDAKRQQQRIDDAQKLGVLETKAYNEDVRLGQSRLALHRQALEEDRKRAEQQRQASALANPNSDESVLARASQTSQRRRIAAQQAIEQSQNFSPGEFENFIEKSIALRLEGQARAQQLRDQGPAGKIKAGALGSSGVSFLERQASIISTTASFALGGQLFQGVLNSLSEVVTGTRQFEEALSNLSVTFNDSTDNLRGFATEVGQKANAIGLTQAQGVEVASRSVGLFNTSGESEQSKKDFGILATEVTGRIAQQSGSQDLTGVETNLAGILRSFQLANSDLTRVEDSIAVISKRTGVTPAEILQASSETATLARAAGFDTFQNSAIIANQSTTTGQPAGAAAEQLTQVFAQATSAQVEAKFNSLGINTNASLADQFQQVSKKVQSGGISQDEFSSLSALFGRSRSGAAFRNLIENLPQVNNIADQARNSPGEGKSQFEQVFGNISSEITKTIGSLRDVATELAQSGLLDILGELVIVIHHGADALAAILHLFNELPRPLRSVALQLTELALAIKLFGGTSAVTRALSLIGGGTGIGQKAITKIAGAEVAEGVAARAAAVGAPGAGLGIAGLLLNPATIVAIGAVATLIAAQKISDAGTAAGRAEASSFIDETGKTHATASEARTSNELRGAASARRQAASAEDDRRGAFLGLGNVVDFFGGHDAARSAARDRREADALDARANQVQTVELNAKAANEQSFGRFNSVDEVTAQLDRLQAKGLTAAQRVEALTTSFDKLADAASKSGVAVVHQGAGDIFTQGLAAGVTGALGSGAQQAGLRAGAANALDNGGFFSNRLASIVDVGASLIGQGAAFRPDEEKAFKDVQNKLQGTDTAKFQGDVQTAIQNVLTTRGIDTSKGDAVLSQEDIDAIKQAGSDQLEAFIKQNIPGGQQFDEIRRIMRDSLKVNLSNFLKGFAAGPVDADQALNFFNATAQEATNTFNETSFRDRAGASATRIKTLKGALDKAKAAVAAPLPNDEGSRDVRPKQQADNLARLQNAQNQFDQALAEDQKVQLESTLSLIHLRESGKGALDQSGRLQDEIDAAQATVNSLTDPTDKNNAQTQVNNLKEQQAQLVVETAASIANSKIDPRNSGALAAQAVTNAQAALTFAQGHGDKKAVADATIALNNANVNNLKAQIAIANSGRTAGVAIGDDVGAANAALANARNDLTGEIKGQADYNNTLAQIHELEQKVADTVNARKNNQRLLRIDLTDPVAQARAERQAAEDTLRSAKGPDARDRARIDLRQKQAAEEAAKFNQRLNDVQTADELGRISHQQYISYLQSEHDRLTSIKHRTRQQQDELNQVDLLMKQTAQALNGQFNIGDIKLPTVYEVRRAIKAGVGGILTANNGFAGAGTGQVVTDNSQRTLIVQGVSVDEVMKRVYALFGGRPVRTTTRRK